LIIIVSYLSWTILDSWKYNTYVNCSIQVALLDSWSQFFTSHAIFNRRAYTQWVDRIISCKSSSFSIRDVAFWDTFPMPQALKPNTFNSCSEANLTNASFGNGGHVFAKVTRISHSCCALARARLATFWSFAFARPWYFPRLQHSF
jgi:hypothetical protein